MSWLGRFQQGDWLPLRIDCRDGGPRSGLPVRPPRALIYRAGTFVASVELPAQDRYADPGNFGARILLDGDFAAGNYLIQYHQNTNGLHRMDTQSFQLVGGGNTAGEATTLQEWRRPEANYIVAQRNDGTIVQGRNPSLSNNEMET